MKNDKFLMCNSVSICINDTRTEDISMLENETNKLFSFSYYDSCLGKYEIIHLIQKLVDTMYI